MKCQAMLACALLVSSPAAFAITDLDLDAAFGTDGTFIADFTDAQGSYDIGIQSFKECDRTSSGLCDFPVSFHYYVAGFHNHLSTQDMSVALISDTGIPAASFGNGGKLTVPTSMTSINDVAFDESRRNMFIAESLRIYAFSADGVFRWISEPLGGYGARFASCQGRVLTVEIKQSDRNGEHEFSSQLRLRTEDGTLLRSRFRLARGHREKSAAA